jgi:D-tyrosyl-tRNA(Tyr) deacylase
MRALIQRVTKASVEVEETTVGRIGPGLLVLLGAAAGDTSETACMLAEKVAGLRIFSDAEGKFNESLLDTSGEVLVVSQFTLLADTRRGRRPSFLDAAEPGIAQGLVDDFATRLRSLGLAVQTGVFGAHMHVHLINDGPVTIMLDSDDWQRPRRG